jgi:hypothetical protein
MFFKFLLNVRGQAFHVTDVNGNPSGVVLVVKSKEPQDQSLQRLHIEGKIPLYVGPHTYQTHNVHVEDCVPVLECWTLGGQVLYPSFFGILIVWFSIHHVQKCILLKLGQSQNTHLVDMSCPGEMRCLEEGVSSARGCDTCLGQCSCPTRYMYLQVVPYVFHIAISI